MLGQHARFTMEIPGGSPRVFTGVVWFVEAEGTATRQTSCLGLVPRLELLEHRKTSRIFQDMTVVDVIGRVLEGAHIPFALKITGRYPVRAYCVRYQETDGVG